MKVLFILPILFLPQVLLAQDISGIEVEEKLKGLVAAGEASAHGATGAQLHPEPPRKPVSPSNAEILSNLAREVEDLKSRVIVTQVTNQATQKPQASKNIGSKTYYNYKEGAIFQLHAGIDRVTDVELQPGEKLTNQPVAGDTVRWTVGTMTSVGKLGEQVHLVVKPLEPDLETNIIVTTNRRVYHLQATSGDWYMPSVAWHYPDDDEAARKAEIEKKKDDEALSLSPEKLDFDYEIVHHDESWTPVRCFDDGQKTYIQMPPAMAVSEAPALFLIEDEEKEPVLVNYRVKGSYYVLDRLFLRAELRAGKNKPVVIYSSRKPRTLWERLF